MQSDAGFIWTPRPEPTAGLTEVIVPERNEADLDDVPRDVRDKMTFHVVGSVDEVLKRFVAPEKKKKG